METLLQIILPVLSGVLLAIMTGLMTYFKSQAKQYKQLLSKQKEQNIRNTIQEELEPIIEEIHRLQERIEGCENLECNHVNAIMGSYKFRLIYLCKAYIRQGHITPDQYEQLSEFYKVYHALGGNGQAEEYYHKTSNLPIKEEEE